MEHMMWETIVAILGIAMSLGYFPQAYRIWQKKDAEEVSLMTFGIFAVGTFVWTVYGVVLGDPVIIASFAVGVAGSWAVLGLAIRYRFFKKDSTQELDETQ
jgi:MtN3 and saliva related transmembrane protein